MRKFQCGNNFTCTSRIRNIKVMNAQLTFVVPLWQKITLKPEFFDNEEKLMRFAEEFDMFIRNWLTRSKFCGYLCFNRVWRWNIYNGFFMTECGFNGFVFILWHTRMYVRSIYNSFLHKNTHKNSSDKSSSLWNFYSIWYENDWIKIAIQWLMYHVNKA